ncbi:bacteriophage CI repressor [Aliarcobacter thereius]|uniref:Bacteriophage CI repressor n=1 Tax=Aliarcobacter thereius TaxID=544718 RepID=A0A5R9H1Y3_9BACT|nr:helix-turn-helix domain-containing protein [Aliarcobacter thereius]TLS72141.1 bacteriophage CI repressor [Aliarcobacter thereius]
MENFEKVITKLKKALNISTDKELAEKLNMKNNTFSERKRTSSLPHSEILSVCLSEKLDLNDIYTDSLNLKKSINYKEEIIKNLEIFDEKQIKYFYYLMEAEKIRN